MGINYFDNKNKSLGLLAADTSRPMPPVRMPRVPATHISGGPPCPYYLDTTDKKSKKQRIRETARPAIELSPTHCFRQEPILARKISKNKKENFFSTKNPQNFKKKKKKKKKKS